MPAYQTSCVIDELISNNLKEIESVGEQIRVLKMNQMNGNDETISIAVNKLNKLKDNALEDVLQVIKNIQKEYDSTSSSRDVSAQQIKNDIFIKMIKFCSFLPTKNKKLMEKELKRNHILAQENAFDKKLYTQGLRIQRKIPHLLCHEGSGDDFVYHCKIDTKEHGLSEGDSVILTEKYDGTTVQATKHGVFKRRDNFQPNDRRKHSASEEERYGIERIDLEHGCKHGLNSYIKQGITPYLSRIGQFEDGLCCYFETFGSQVQSRFRLSSNPNPTSTLKVDVIPSSSSSSSSEQWHDIRVFDFSRHGKFLSWSECCSLAHHYQLPMVGYSDLIHPLSLPRLLLKLSAMPTYSSLQHQPQHTHHKDVPLEGYVIRKPCRNETSQLVEDEEKICKIRVEDLPKIERPCLYLQNTLRFTVFTPLDI